MKVRLTFDLDDLDRMAVAYSNARVGKATSRQMREFCRRVTYKRLGELRVIYNNDPDVRLKAARKLDKLGPGLNMKPATTVVADLNPDEFFEAWSAADAVARKRA